MTLDFKGLTTALFALLLTVFAIPALAQDNIYVKHFPQFKDSTITAVAQDIRGERWAGTRNGVYRFNNLSTSKFKNDPADSTTFTGGAVSSILLDANGIIWVGTNQGLNRYVDKSRSWVQYTTKTHAAAGLTSENVTALLEDQQGVIWVGTSNGLYALYLESGKFDHYPIKGRASTRIQALALDEQGQLWIGTASGLYQLNRSTGVYTRLPYPQGINSLNIQALVVDPKSNLWVGTNSGLYYRDVALSTWTSVPANDSTTQSLSSKSITALAQDGFQSLWVATADAGLNRLRFDDGSMNSYTINVYQHDSTRSNSLKDNRIVTLFKDRASNIYIGTRSGLDRRDASLENIRDTEAKLERFVDELFGESKDTTQKEDAAPTTSLSGYLYYSKQHPAGGAVLLLKDEAGNVVATTTTSPNGAFVFSQLPADQQYMIVVDETDAPLSNQAVLYLTNDNGEVVMKVKGNEEAVFVFNTLSRDQVNEMELLDEEDERLLALNLYGQVYEELPGDVPAGMKVYILNDDGEILFVTTTLADGRFVFEELPPDQSYIFMVEDMGDRPLNIQIMTKDDLVVKKLFQNEEGTFKYERLSPDEAIITLVDEDDLEIKIRPEDIFINNNIYYDYNSAEINVVAAKELDKLAMILKNNRHLKVELSSHTDARGSAAYNKDLSQARADAVVAYLIAKGVNRDAVVGTGFGESQLINQCTEQSSCSEFEHGKNRRTEFKFITRS